VGVRGSEPNVERITFGHRGVGWANYGDPSGTPVVAVHGSPDSHMIWKLFDAEARTCGVRLIAIDRPGFGLSDAQPGRAVRDWPDDVAGVLDHLGVARAGVLAISGGAAYACASAWRLPERVTGLGLFSVLAPLDERSATDGVNRQVRLTYALARHAPWLLQPIVASLARSAWRAPERALRRLERTRPPEDREVIARPEVRAVLLENLPNQFRDATTIMHEFRLAVRPWGIPLDQVQVGTHIWQGGRDDVHTERMARTFAKRIPHAVLHVEPSFATFTYLDHLQPILTTLASWTG
jgi:pimeloyl-ACP methyl ester carboxylesterase